jgi:hypothetical protein
MSEALIEGRDFPRSGADDDDTPAAVRIINAAPYEPDAAAYLPDPKNDRPAQLQRALDAGDIVGTHLSIPTADGRREQIDLDAAETRSYYDSATLPIRERFVNRKIAERRARTAAKAARGLMARAGGRFDRALLTPDEEACLRETRALVPRSILRESGEGYDAGEVLTDRFRAFALREVALTSLKLLEDDGDFWDGSDGPGGSATAAAVGITASFCRPAGRHSGSSRSVTFGIPAQRRITLSHTIRSRVRAVISSLRLSSAAVLTSSPKTRRCKTLSTSS